MKMTDFLPPTDTIVTAMKTEAEVQIANTFKTQSHRVHIKAETNDIIFDLDRNRHIEFSLRRLTYLKQLFEADEIILHSPIRCKIVIRCFYRDGESETDG